LLLLGSSRFKKKKKIPREGSGDAKKKDASKLKIKSDLLIEEDEKISESAAEDAILDAAILQRLEGETEEEWVERSKIDDEARQERARRKDVRDARKKRGVHANSGLLDGDVASRDGGGVQEGEEDDGGGSVDGTKVVQVIVFGVCECVCECVCVCVCTSPQYISHALSSYSLTPFHVYLTYFLFKMKRKYKKDITKKEDNQFEVVRRKARQPRHLKYVREDRSVTSCTCHHSSL
jgi:hypothetical protein